MRTALFSPLALGTVVFFVLAEPAALGAAEPVKLTETQMDAVAAGTVAVVMNALTTADGANTSTYTSTSTTVFSTPGSIVDIGLGFGTAVACCGSGTDTSVQTVYDAEGDKVISNSTVNDISNPLFSLSNGVTTVIAVDVPSQ